MIADFTPVTPWPKPDREDCSFYTCMDFPDGETVEAVNWDHRGLFAEYVGNYPVAGKSVLDVGTASGFLAFSAEQAGARSVTAIDGRDAREFNRIPFLGTGYTDDRAAWVRDTNVYLQRLKASFWYGWHKYQSKVDVVYTPVADLWAWERRFDVVIAGAIVEHISDPVPFISNLCGLANEAVIIAFTPVLPTQDMVMQAMNGWDNPAFNYSWFALSVGMYQRLFTNLGFSCELAPAKALCNEYDPPMMVERPTVIARRMR